MFLAYYGRNKDHHIIRSRVYLSEGEEEGEGEIESGGGIEKATEGNLPILFHIKISLSL